MKEYDKIVDELGKEIENNKKIPENINNKLNKTIFENLIIAISIIIYFIILNLLFKNLKIGIYTLILRISTLIIGISSICILEISYKKENVKIMWWGIEALILAIITMLNIYMCIISETKYTIYLTLYSHIFAIYYVLKNVFLYNKIKKEYIKSLSDIDEIVKKEEPQKVKQTTRKRK